MKIIFEFITNAVVVNGVSWSLNQSSQGMLIENTFDNYKLMSRKNDKILSFLFYSQTLNIFRRAPFINDSNYKNR